jgi:hypothetical protein
MVYTVFEELVRDKTSVETCDFLRSHAIRHDQQNKENATRQLNSIIQAISVSKKDKVKQVLALVNELKIQDSTCSDDELEAMVCKLAQVPPEIWMTLPLEAKTWLLNERTRQQIKDDKLKSHPIQTSKKPPSLQKEYTISKVYYLLSYETTSQKPFSDAPDISHILMPYWFESILCLD